MGRLARQEGTKQIKLFYLIVFALLLNACNPIIGASSLLHSIATGNTVGVVTGGAGVAVEQSTGKTISEHVLDDLKVKKQEHKMSEPTPRPLTRAQAIERLRWVFTVEKRKGRN